MLAACNASLVAFARAHGIRCVYDPERLWSVCSVILPPATCHFGMIATSERVWHMMLHQLKLQLLKAGAVAIAPALWVPSVVYVPVDPYYRFLLAPSLWASSETHNPAGDYYRFEMHLSYQAPLDPGAWRARWDAEEASMRQDMPCIHQFSADDVWQRMHARRATPRDPWQLDMDNPMCYTT
jgi:hypothetical protein